MKKKFKFNTILHLALIISLLSPPTILAQSMPTKNSSVKKKPRQGETKNKYELKRRKKAGGTYGAKKNKLSNTCFKKTKYLTNLYCILKYGMLF